MVKGHVIKHGLDWIVKTWSDETCIYKTMINKTWSGRTWINKLWLKVSDGHHTNPALSRIKRFSFAIRYEGRFLLVVAGFL